MKHPGLTNIVKEDSNEVFEWSEDSFIKACSNAFITRYLHVQLPQVAIKDLIQ